MIKTWATVISWQNNIALVSCEIKIVCSKCTSCATYYLNLPNQRLPQTNYIISVISTQALIQGQKVELGISEESLLYLVALVYLLPLVMLLIIASISQVLFNTDFAAICGSVLGGIIGFLLARSISNKQTKYKSWQLTILSTETPSY